MTRTPPNPFDLSGKVSLVTGGNRGIGLGMAQALAAAGSDVVIWGRDKDRNEEAKAALASHGGRVFAQALDIADEAAVRAAMQEAVGEMGRLDSFIANAGIGVRGTPFLDLDMKTFRETLSVNVEGAAIGMREACRAMAARAEAGEPGGSIIGISSIAAIQGVSRNQAYAASKGAMIALIKAIAVEHSRHGIRANVILPGWIATDRTAWARENADLSSAVVKRTPARRWGRAEDFGGIAVYLTSDASAFHTGDVMVIDGGYSIF